jgi:hypothetical protein
MTSFLFAKKYIGGFEMIEIGRVEELDRASHYPKEVQEKILEAVEIFAESRDRTRDRSGMDKIQVKKLEKK